MNYDNIPKIKVYTGNVEEEDYEENFEEKNKQELNQKFYTIE